MPGDVLGIDIGGVIIKKIDESSDTSFDEDFERTPAVVGAIGSIKLIMARRFGDNVYLVSKCGAKIEALTRRWLDLNFFQQTGFNPDNVHFCEQRNQKAPICDALRITHFIDDRLEVLSHLDTVKNLYLFQPTDDEVARFSTHLGAVTTVHSWADIAHELLGNR